MPTDRNSSNLMPSLKLEAITQITNRYYWYHIPSKTKTKPCIAYPGKCWPPPRLGLARQGWNYPNLSIGGTSINQQPKGCHGEDVPYKVTIVPSPLGDLRASSK